MGILDRLFGRSSKADPKVLELLDALQVPEVLENVLCFVEGTPLVFEGSRGAVATYLTERIPKDKEVIQTAPGIKDVRIEYEPDPLRRSANDFGRVSFFRAFLDGGTDVWAIEIIRSESDQYRVFSSE